MKIERTKNAVRSIIFNGLLKTYQIIVPFIMRTAVIYYLGAKYLGLNSLFLSIISVLNLTELGVGSAMIYSMYKPIAENDQHTICALMKLYQKYYRVIGAVVLGLGMILMPFIPRLIKGEIPADINIFIIYLMNLSATVLTYWLFSYKSSLLSAFQRYDVLAKCSIAITTVQYLLQFMILVIWQNYYAYFGVAILLQIINNVVVAKLVNTMYPEFIPFGTLERDFVKDINQRIRDLFTSKIGSVIVDSSDSIIISAFLGLITLTMYQNYFYILTAVFGFITIIMGACTAGIGNSLIVESIEKNYKDLKNFTFIIIWIATCCTSCFLCLYQPFMRIWMGNELMLSFIMVISFCVYFYMRCINAIMNLYKDSAGMWHTDRFRPLVTALSNLLMNLIMVQFIGIYGVLLSTILSTVCIGMPWILHNLFTYLFCRKPWEYIKKLVLYTVNAVLICGVVYWITGYVPEGGFLWLVPKLVICLLLSNGILWILYHRLDEYHRMIELFVRILHLNSLSGKFKKVSYD